MKTLKLIWNWLNGNKTIICLGSVTVIEKLIDLQLLTQTKVIEFIVWLLIVLGTGSLGHHIQKKYFSTEKG